MISLTFKEWRQTSPGAFRRPSQCENVHHFRGFDPLFPTRSRCHNFLRDRTSFASKAQRSSCEIVAPRRARGAPARGRTRRSGWDAVPRKPPLPLEAERRKLRLWGNTSRPVSRVLCTSLRWAATIPLGRRSRGASSNPPERPARRGLAVSRRVVPIRSCSRWGLPCRPCCQRRGGLLPHRFTLTSHGIDTRPENRPEPHERRSVLCGTVPGVAPAGRYPAPFLRGARTFLPRRLSTCDESGRPADWCRRCRPPRRPSQPRPTRVGGTVHPPARSRRGRP